MLEYTDGYKYQVHHDFVIRLSFAPPKAIVTDFLSFNLSCNLGIRKGWAWDGMSGGMMDTRSSMQGSAVHDALYSFLRQGLLPLSYRGKCDDELKRICLDDKMWESRAAYHRWGLRKAGRAAALPSAIKRVYRAP